MKTYRIQIVHHYEGSIVFLPFDTNLTLEDAEKRKKEYDRVNGPHYETEIVEEN